MQMQWRDSCIFMWKIGEKSNVIFFCCRVVTMCGMHQNLSMPLLWRVYVIYFSK